MGLFRKKTPKEILAEGKAQYVKGDLKKAFITLHGLAAKGNPQACYYIGRLYLEWKDKSLAQSFLTTAAKGGEKDAAALLSREFGIQEEPPQKPQSHGAAETKEDAGEETHILFSEEYCLGALECGLCKDACIADAITIEHATNFISIDRQKCIGCASCVETCPMGALDIL